MKSILYLLLIHNCYALQHYCIGNNACTKYIWTGDYNIKCGGENSKGACHFTTLNCEDGETCSIYTEGDSSDIYQTSIVNAQKSKSFKLTCESTGKRNCQNIIIWCPQSPNTNCECIGCESSVTMYCIPGISCINTNLATIKYIGNNTENKTNYIRKIECENNTFLMLCLIITNIVFIILLIKKRILFSNRKINSR